MPFSVRTVLYRSLAPPLLSLRLLTRLVSASDIGPISEGHALVIPKFHGAKLHDIPDEHLHELLPVAKKIAIATGAEQYNILQNNGRLAHQLVDHVHCKSPCSVLPPALLTVHYSSHAHQSTSSPSPTNNRVSASAGQPPSLPRRTCKPSTRG